MKSKVKMVELVANAAWLAATLLAGALAFAFPEKFEALCTSREFWLALVLFAMFLMLRPADAKGKGETE